MQTDKIALVTGAGSGIGRASSLALARAGYQVVLLGRRADALERTCTTAREESADVCARLHPMPADVTNEGAVRKVFEEIESRFGRLDVLFNNAGTGAPPVHIDELSIEQWRAVVDINLNAVFICSREAFRLMRHQDPRGGRIINNGSISAHAPRPLSAAYTRHQACDHRPDQGDLARWPRLRHRLRSDRHRQRGHRDDRAHGRRHPAGQRPDDGRTAHGRAACGRCGGPHGEPAARRPMCSS